MRQTIASTYELIEKLGSGGGGNVYLARQLRLNKKVVLKADKRKLSVREELLRREVDILKELSHPYIPKVYDFFVEGEEVYTVMDYIEGESLDKALKRGETFSQSQVIRWACQLLEALSYLHSPTHGDPPRGFVHSDIKPANLMRTLQGNICLIDFNIALALGEKNVIGCSPGYASPEHYGLDFSTQDEMENDIPENEDTGITVTLPVSESEQDPGQDSLTLTLAQHVSSKVSSGQSEVRRKSFSGISKRRMVNPDIRSDIYSIGATLYHLLDGSRPPKNAKEVVCLSEKRFSPQVVRIISKAMNPDPGLRYQTADEMREDFLSLRKRDPRVRRWKRGRLIASVLCTVFFAAGSASAFVGLKRMQRMENWINLTEVSRKAWEQGDVEAAVNGAMEVLSASSNQWKPEHVPGVEKVLTEALGIYDLSDGYKPYKTIELPSPPLDLAISPDGKSGMALCGQSVIVFDLAKAEILAEFPVKISALAEIKYLDNDTILYAGEDGIKAYNLSKSRELWIGSAAAAISLSGNKKYAAGIFDGESFATVYNAETGKVKCRIDFGGKQQRPAIGDNLFALNQDGSWMGVSLQDGSIHLYDLENPGNEIAIYDSGSEYTHFEGGFYDRYFAFSASNQEESTFAVIDMEDQKEKGGFQSETAFRVQTDESGIYVQLDQVLVRIEPDTGDQIPLVTMEEKIVCFARCGDYTLAASENGIYFFDKEAQLISFCEEEGRNDLADITEEMAVIGSMDKPVIRIMQYEENQDSELFVYDSDYEHDEARASADEETVTLFSYERFRIYDRKGTIVKDVSLREPDHILNQQFVRESGESFLRVIYDDGKICVYSARDGELLKEEKDENFSGELDEEFLIGSLRIESPLHGTPTVYDMETGEEIARLKKDTYLTYVSQAGEYIVTQYITADGYCSGQLLNDKCEVLAELPYLCDVMGETLLFDYPTGTVRRSRIYGLEELMDIAGLQIRNR